MGKSVVPKQVVAPDNRATKAQGSQPRRSPELRAVYDLSQIQGGGTEANRNPPNHLGESYLRQRLRGSGSAAVNTAVIRTDYADGTYRRNRTLTLHSSQQLSLER